MGTSGEWWWGASGPSYACSNISAVAACAVRDVRNVLAEPRHSHSLPTHLWCPGRTALNKSWATLLSIDDFVRIAVLSRDSCRRRPLFSCGEILHHDVARERGKSPRLGSQLRSRFVLLIIVFYHYFISSLSDYVRTRTQQRSGLRLRQASAGLRPWLRMRPIHVEIHHSRLCRFASNRLVRPRGSRPLGSRSVLETQVRHPARLCR